MSGDRHWGMGPSNEEPKCLSKSSFSSSQKLSSSASQASSDMPSAEHEDIRKAWAKECVDWVERRKEALMGQFVLLIACTLLGAGLIGMEHRVKALEGQAAHQQRSRPDAPPR